MCYQLFPRSQHFTVTSVSMLCAVRCARLYVTTARPAENTRLDKAMVAHTAKSSHTMGARAGYVMLPLRAHQCSMGSPSSFTVSFI